MGIVSFGIPEQETEYLRSLMGLDVVVEGGTYKGGTAILLSKSFGKVYTIEKSKAMYEIAKDNLKDLQNVNLLQGDTREHLKYILDNNDNILIWLDAHWSGGDTYGEEDECPLIEELEIIFHYQDKNMVILIDDARLFLAPPPYPHKIEEWPSLTEILRVMPTNWELLELEDVLYLFPQSKSEDIKSFIQKITTDRWKQYGKNKQYSFLKGVKMAIIGILKGKIK
jgi:16S rRNA G966 N2-methylase RsmD